MAEEPEYKIIENLGDCTEIRQYSKQVWITTVSSGENEAFSTLAAYISGGNEQGLKIPMTAPVITYLIPEGIYVAFIMPREYKIRNLPKPLTDKIKLKEISERKLAVISSSSYVTQMDYETCAKILRDKLQKKKLHIKGEPLILQYNSPATSLDMRINEIAYEII